MLIAILILMSRLQSHSIKKRSFRGLLIEIMKQAGITREELLDLL